MFEPFFRVDKSRSRELGGVGLGLALVREIVRVHDGSITVRSNPSGGTIFEVSFMMSLYDEMVKNIDKSPSLRYSFKELREGVVCTVRIV